MHHKTLFAVAPFVLLAAPAQAQDNAGSTRLVDALAQCRSITGDTDRLACFDRSAAAVVAARQSGDLLVMDRTRVVERKRAGFGLAMDDTAMFGGGPEDKATEVREVDSTIQSVASGGYARFDMALANGSVWQTVEPVRFPPRAGQSINLTAGLLGSFKAKINDGAVVKVKRLR